MSPWLLLVLLLLPDGSYDYTGRPADSQAQCEAFMIEARAELVVYPYPVQFGCYKLEAR